MAHRDLTDGKGNLHPLALFRVLAVMCHPQDALAQARMIALIQAQTGLGPAKRPKLDTNGFWREVQKSSHGGMVAGGLLLNVLQLHYVGEFASLNQAIAMLQPLLSEWRQPTDIEWHLHDPLAHTPRRRVKLLESFRTYLPVAHLWGALIFSGQNNRPDIWPGSNETLPRFLGYAEALAKMANSTPWRGKDRRVLLPKRTPIRFKIPSPLHESPRLDAELLHEEQKEFLAKSKNRN